MERKKKKIYTNIFFCNNTAYKNKWQCPCLWGLRCCSFPGQFYPRRCACRAPGANKAELFRCCGLGFLGQMDPDPEFDLLGPLNPDPDCDLEICYSVCGSPLYLQSTMEEYSIYKIENRPENLIFIVLYFIYVNVSTIFGNLQFRRIWQKVYERTTLFSQILNN